MNGSQFEEDPKMTGEISEPRAVVDWVRQEYAMRPFAFGTLAGAMRRLSDGLNAKSAHFLFELIQNADDNTYEPEVEPDLTFDLRDVDPTSTPGAQGCLIIRNNEVGFRREDIEALCSADRSTKKKTLGFIGEKGIGFKAVFSVCPRPHVVSNGYSLYFEKNPTDGSLPYVCPHWFESGPGLAEGARTTILLPLAEGVRDELQKALLELDPSTLLFLNKLRRLSVIEEGRPVRSMTSTVVLDRAPDARLVSLGDGVNEPVRYWLFHRMAARPRDLTDPERVDVTDARLTIALSETGAGAGRVFVYLPTEVTSGLPFLINADFLTTSSRDSLHVDKDWNKWIRDEFGRSVAEAMLSMRRLSDEPRDGCDAHRLPEPTDTYRLVPDKSRLSEHEFFLPLWEHAYSRLQRESFVLCSLFPGITERLKRPAEARRVPKALRELLEPSGDPCPRLGVPFGIVDYALNALKAPLEAVGVRDVSCNEVAGLLEPAWLARRSAAWFVAFFDYLRSRSWHLDKGIPALPTEDGLATRVEPVFIRGKDDVILPESLSTLVPLRLLRPDVAEALKAEAVSMKYLADEFRLKPLKSEDVILESLMPKLTGSSPSLIFDATRYIALCWERLSEAAKKTIKQSLPLLLDAAASASRDSALALPEAFSPRGGWPLVFPAGPDRAHLRVLSDDYARVPESERGSMALLLRALGATDAPPPATVTGSGWEKSLSQETKHWAYEVASSSTRGIEVTDYKPPAWLLASGTTESLAAAPERARALLRWLKRWGADQPRRRNGDFLTWESATVSWFYRQPQSDRGQSAFLRALTCSRWVPTTRGLQRPAVACADSPEMRELFGGDLPYVVEVPADCFSVLQRYGLNVSPTPGMALQFLRGQSAEDAALDPSLAERLYVLLNGATALAVPEPAEALIYIPGASQAWHRTAEVTWADTSVVLGDRFPCLSKRYPKLKDLFVTKWQVSEDAPPEAYLDGWRSLPLSGWGKQRVERALTTIYSRMRALVGREESRLRGLPVWTVDGTFAIGRAYLPDDPGLEERFRGLVPYAWLPARTEPQSLTGLLAAVGVSRLQCAVQKEIVSLVTVQDAKPRLLTNGARKLLRGALWKECEQDPMAQGRAQEALDAFTEEAFKVLVVRYSLSEASVEADDLAAFVERSCLLVGADADPEEARQEAAKLLTAALFGSPNPQIEDLIFRCLTVTEEHADRELRRRGLLAPAGEPALEAEKEKEAGAGAPEMPKPHGTAAAPRSEEQGQKKNVLANEGEVFSGAAPGQAGSGVAPGGSRRTAHDTGSEAGAHTPAVPHKSMAGGDTQSPAGGRDIQGSPLLSKIDP